jgi:hypothetical protein
MLDIEKNISQQERESRERWKQSASDLQADLMRARDELKAVKAKLDAEAHEHSLITIPETIKTDLKAIREFVIAGAQHLVDTEDRVKRIDSIATQAATIQRGNTATLDKILKAVQDLGNTPPPAPPVECKCCKIDTNPLGAIVINTRGKFYVDRPSAMSEEKTVEFLKQAMGILSKKSQPSCPGGACPCK